MADKMEGVVASGGTVDPKYGVPIETYAPLKCHCERANSVAAST